VVNSNIEVILSEIQAVSDDEIEEIQREAQEREQQILEKANREAESIFDRAEAAAAGRAEEERARLLSEADEKADEINSGARKELFEEALEQVRSRLANLRQDDDVYPQVLAALTKEALDQLRLSELDGGLILKADPRDETLLGGLAEEIESEMRIKYELETWGGVMACDHKEQIIVDNTLESRLKQAESYLYWVMVHMVEER
jgi:vacuolar-type H+-ATPase subunit E/Vma4